MKSFLLSHSADILFILFISFIASMLLVINYRDKSKTIGSVLAGALVLFLPLVFHYEYIFPYSYHILSIFCLSSTYYLITPVFKHPIAVALAKTTLISASLLLFLCLSAVAFLDYITADKRAARDVYKVYGDNEYMVRYHYHECFPLRYYELRKYSAIPILTKHVEACEEYENTCEFAFENHKLLYDRCRNTLKSFE
jgi:hypothetical protein